MKDLIPYIISALSILLAYIFHLRAKNVNLTNKVGQLKAEGDLREVLVKKELAKNESTKSEEDYKNTRDKWLSEHAGDGAGESEF